MVGMEEGILPHMRSFDDPMQMEEERRLAYVGITRAKERLYMVRAFRRMHMGSSLHHPASRFLKDLPKELVASRRTVEDEAQELVAQMPHLSRLRRGNGASSSGPRPVSSDAMFAAGDRVRHAKFGEGVVVNCVVKQQDQEVTVAFKGQGVKKLLLSFAALEKV
jgi:DNA helicase-2/ATP-dependent DNA helicase PcrA